MPKLVLMGSKLLKICISLANISLNEEMNKTLILENFNKNYEKKTVLFSQILTLKTIATKKINENQSTKYKIKYNRII